MPLFSVNPATKDLLFVQGQLVLERDDNLCTAQRLECKFREFLGEWFLDTRIGIPYFQAIYVKAPDLQLVERIFRRVLATEPMISQVTEMNLSLSGRELTFTFSALLTSGAVLSGGSGTPFIVEPS